MITRILQAIGVAAACVSVLLLAGCGDDGEKPKTPEGEEQQKGIMERAGEKAGELSRKAKEKSVETFEKAKEGAKDFGEGFKKGLEGEEQDQGEKPPAESPPAETP